MEMELRRIEKETGKKFGISEKELMRSNEFRRAYEYVRMPKEDAINNFVRSLGSNSEHMLIKLTRMDNDTLEFLRNIHQRVINELRGSVRTDFQSYR